MSARGRKSRGSGAKSKPKQGVVTHLFGQHLTADMELEFLSWLPGTTFVQKPDDAPTVLTFTKMGLELLRARRPRFVVTAWTKDDSDLFGSLVEGIRVDDSMPARTADFAGRAALTFVSFLEERGHWTGTADDLEYCFEVLQEVTGVRVAATPEALTPNDIALPFVEPQHEYTALTALPLIDSLTTFIEWFGSGKPVTATGVLRPADAKTLAGQLGIEVPPTVRSARDVAVLDRLWTVVQATDIVRVGSTKATTGAGFELWRRADLDITRSVVAAWVIALLNDDGAKPEVEVQADILLEQLLLAAMTDHPVLADAGVPDDAPAEMRFIEMVLDRKINALVDDGLFGGGDELVVPNPLRPAVLGGLTVLYRTEPM